MHGTWALFDGWRSCMAFNDVWNSVMHSKRVSKQCERMSGRMSQWPNSQYYRLDWNRLIMPWIWTWLSKPTPQWTRRWTTERAGGRAISRVRRRATTPWSLASISYVSITESKGHNSQEGQTHLPIENMNKEIFFFSVLLLEYSRIFRNLLEFSGIFLFPGWINHGNQSRKLCSSESRNDPRYDAVRLKQMHSGFDDYEKLTEWKRDYTNMFD